MLVAWFVFLPLMGHPAAFGWQPWPMLRSFIANQMWGVGHIALMPLLNPRPAGGRQRDWNQRRLAA